MDMMIKAEKLAEELYTAYDAEEKDGRECGNLLLEWIQENFWGIVVQKHIPVFLETWELLHEAGHTKKNPLGYGDISGDIWVEYPKNKKVIVVKSHSSCADDRTHIFIYNEVFPGWETFTAVTVWDRENRKGGYKVKPSKAHPNGWFSWGDDRDIKVPSLNTYRKRGFKYGYSDCRDKGHCFKYENISNKVGRVEKAHWHESKLKHALWVLKYANDIAGGIENE